MRGEGRGRRGFFVLDDFEICFNSLTEPGSHHHTEQNLAIFLNKSNSRRSDHGAKERWFDERKKTANSSSSQRPGATDPSFNPGGAGHLTPVRRPLPCAKSHLLSFVSLQLEAVCTDLLIS